MPFLATLDALAPALHLIAVFVFATSGALAAAAKRQTFVTFAFFALVTGVGGGTVRDLLIEAPVFWMHDSIVPLVCLGAALIVWVAPEGLFRPRALDWFDAVGLAAYSVFGADKALRFGADPVPAMLMGVITACVGGIIRDTLSGQPSILMRPEVYVSASALAAAFYVCALMLGVPVAVAGLAAFCAGFALRAAAIHWGWGLPLYRAKPGRSE